MIRCFVIDDEPHAIAKMETFIRKTPFLELAGSFTDPLEAVSHFSDQSVDLLFVDIQMPDISGIDLIKMVPKEIMVIFTTGYSQYAVEGYEYNATDYLLKPITYARFLKAAQKALDIHSKKNLVINPPKEYFFIKGELKGKQIKINFKDIEYIEGGKNYIHLHCVKDKHMVIMNMKDIEADLPSEMFVRVHNSYIIPIKNIVAIEGNSVQLETQQKGKVSVPIGTTFKPRFLAKINSN